MDRLFGLYPLRIAGSGPEKHFPACIACGSAAPAPCRTGPVAAAPSMSWRRSPIITASSGVMPSVRSAWPITSAFVVRDPSSELPEMSSKRVSMPKCAAICRANGFRGSHDIHAAGAAGGIEQLRDPGVELVFEHALRHEVFAREGDGPFGLCGGHAVEGHERLLERRADEADERLQVRNLDAEAFQGVPHRAGDAGHRVGECAVEVEEEVFAVHGGWMCG